MFNRNARWARIAPFFAVIAQLGCSSSGDGGGDGADAAIATDSGGVSSALDAELVDSGVATDGSTVPGGDAGTLGDTRPSEGCARARGERLDSAVTASAGADVDVMMVVDGRMRVAHVHFPPSATDDPEPVVVNMHGLNSNATQQRALSGMLPIADRERFILVEPEGFAVSGATTGGSGQAWNGGECCVENMSDPGRTDDIAFLRMLVERVAHGACTDERRVYATGMSNGAWMSNRIACEAGDLFAAVAPVSGAGRAYWPGCSDRGSAAECSAAGEGCTAIMDPAACYARTPGACSWVGTSTTGSCVAGCAWTGSACRRQLDAVTRDGVVLPRTLTSDYSYDCPNRAGGVPALLVNGTADPGVPIAGWMPLPFGARYPAFDETVATYLTQNGCDPTPMETTLACPFDASCAGHRSERMCGSSDACTWSDGVCHSICDIVAGCRAIAPTSAAEVLQCRRHDDSSTCVADATCEWDAADVCTDCRDVFRRDYTCTTGGVRVFLNENGGHCWPGALGCSVAIDGGSLWRASESIWEFFNAHPMP